MDWELFNKNDGENQYLREQIIYLHKILYYIARIINIIFRYLWIINIFLHFNSLFTEYSDIIGFSFALIQIFRRFIWIFFRLENEHLNNYGQFRAVRDISIKLTRIENENTSTNQQNNQRDFNEDTTIIKLPMTTVNYLRRETGESIRRKKTDAKDFFDQMNTVFTSQTNLQFSSAHSLNSNIQ